MQPSSGRFLTKAIQIEQIVLFSFQNWTIHWFSRMAFKCQCDKTFAFAHT
jgi:hypothetical protein